MWISEVNLENIKCFPKANLEFSKNINILVGSNNCGKSTILQSILNLQDFQYKISSLRINELKGNTIIQIKDVSEEEIRLHSALGQLSDNEDFIIEIPLYKHAQGQPVAHTLTQIRIGDPSFRGLKPYNLIYPYLSKRKVTDFIEEFNSETTNKVSGNISNLYAKVTSLSNPTDFNHQEYIEACENILGFKITYTSSEKGTKATLNVDRRNNICIDSMGEGVSSLLGLIVDLCVAENKIFLIEEIENDIHPKSLKKLLKLIEDKSSNNQFIITTHSNIVLKYLGSQRNKIFQVNMKLINGLPTSTVHEVGITTIERQSVLEDLGYEFYDSNLWSAWLILEESSAERIIREYLIKWFAPELIGKLRTISTNGISKIEPTFDDFNRLFVFLHLEPIYKNRAWVLIDAGEKEEKVILKLRNIFCPNWPEETFQQLSKHDFEHYYPSIFCEDIESALSQKDNHKRTSKYELLAKVISWIEEDEENAKKLFEISAAEVIGKIKNISQKIID